jgi:hypothetical protein
MTLNEIEDLREQLEREEANYLRRFGWNYTSKHPGSLWLWEKEFAGQLFVCDQGTALHLTESIYPEGETDAN